MRWSWLLPLLVLAACARPPTTGLDASPARAWTDRQARCRVSTPAGERSCRAVVVRSAAGAMGLVLLADEGPVLARLAPGQDPWAVEELRPALPLLVRLVSVWAPGSGAERVHDGDPSLLRRLEGPGPVITVGGYRLWEGGLLATRAAAGTAVTLTLGDPRPDAALGTPADALH